MTFQTRLHSSRMRTARALIVVSHSMLVGGGGGLVRGVSAPGGVSALGGSDPGGCLLWGGGLLREGVCSRGVSAPPC